MCGSSIRLTFITLAVMVTLAVSASPEVTNVIAGQREDTTLVDVHYDLCDLEEDSVTVWLLSSHDGGVHFEIPIMYGLEGSDIGGGVIPGLNKHIVWDAGIEYPDQASCEHVVSVYACDGCWCHKSEAYTILGVVREGALAYFWQNLSYVGGTLELFGAMDEVEDAVYFTYSLSNLTYTGFTCTATVSNSPYSWGPASGCVHYVQDDASAFEYYPGFGAFYETGW